MRKLYPAVLALGIGTSASAQNILNVLFDPDPIHACELIEITMIGNYPSNNYEPVFYTFDDSTFHLEFHATGSGTSPQTPFNQPFPPIGPLDPGSYTFVADLILDGTIVDTWTEPITVLPPAAYDAGISTYGNEVCPAGPSIPLISFLDGTPTAGGDWVDSFGSPHGPNFVPGSDPQGFYTYQFILTAPCTSLYAEVQILYLPGNDPGFSNTFAYCQTGDAIALFDSLGGTPYTPGTWTAPGGGSFSGTYDPDLHPGGVYTYTVPPIAPCAVGSSSTITITEMPLSNAGLGGTVEICFDDTSLILNSALTGAPAQTGIWADPSSVVFGSWDAEYDASNPDHYPGTYTYIVMNANCPADTAFVTVVEVGPPCDIGYAEHDGAVGRMELIPNPASGPVTLELELLDAGAEHHLEVLDVNGRSMFEEKFTGRGASLLRRALDLGHLPRGAYLVRVRNDQGSSARRLMLQ